MQTIKKLIMTRGLPGSGKSYWAKDVAEVGIAMLSGCRRSVLMAEVYINPLKEAARQARESLPLLLKAVRKAPMYRFFYHYYKGKKRMSVHFKGVCMVVNDIVCKVPCETHWNKRQPRLVMRGFAERVTVVEGIACIT